MKKKIALILFLILVAFESFAFKSGFTLGLKANFTGTLTHPLIGKADMDYLGGDGMKGMLGYITTGDAELTYIFDSVKYLGYEDASIFGGLGLAFNFGVGQGFSGQISGQYNDTLNKRIDVFCRVYMTPVLNMGTSLKTYLLKNRLVLGFGTGINMPLDPHPTYELYTNLTKEEITNLKSVDLDFDSETGTLIITPNQMKKMNPVGFNFKGFIEYNQPVISSMELMLGAFMSYTVYKPRYVTMPQKLIDAAKKGGLAKTPPVNVDVENTPINSFYMNSLNFGLSMGLLFKI